MAIFESYHWQINNLKIKMQEASSIYPPYEYGLKLILHKICFDKQLIK